MTLSKALDRIGGYGLVLLMALALGTAAMANDHITVTPNGIGGVIRPIIINDEPGGPVSQALEEYNALKDSGVPVILRGICLSACTFILILPHDQVCVEPTASLGFHLASEDDKSLPDFTQALIRRYYPKPVQDWLATKKLTSDVIFMDAKTIVANGVYPACGDDRDSQ